MGYNIQQKQAIETVDGPVLIIAGPGTGKTYTLVERVMYMIEEKSIDPSSILISTFTNKASFELLDRISIKFNQLDIKKDTNEMMVSNFHGICKELLEENIEYSNLNKGFTLIDDITQSYLINRYLFKFRKIQNISQIINPNKEVDDIKRLVNKIREEAIVERTSSDNVIQTGFEVLSIYEDILKSYNMVDFSGLLFNTFLMLSENDDLRHKLRERINYIMIDEYQDTNPLQEKIIFLLLNENQNICVVGDDDQSLYRFRGATVRNILEFDKKFEDVKVIKLMQNYRSDDSIIKFYTDYIQNDSEIDIDKYRHKKLLFSDKISNEKRVVKILENDEESWIVETFNKVKELVKTKKINSYNEVCMLFGSITNPSATKMISYFKKNGIDVYIPKTNTLLSRPEVLYLIGGFYYIFKDIIDKNIEYKDRDTQNFLDTNYERLFKRIQNKDDVRDYLDRMKKFLSEDKFSLSIEDIYYRLLAYNPFYTFMKDSSKAKNISKYFEIIDSFTFVNRMYQINEKNIATFVKIFFYDFIKFIKDQKIQEHEEEASIPDENSISAMTIHSSKGLEYPVVIVASLWEKVYANRYKNNADKLIEHYYNLKKINNEFEPFEVISNLDFKRKYYTAFSRAKDLLVLSGHNGSFNKVSKDFSVVLDRVENFSIDEINIEPEEKKERFEKQSYSYTRDISKYLKSPIEYYYEEILKFRLPKTKALFYGSIVHESIEYFVKELIKTNLFEESKVSQIVTEIARQKYTEGAFMITQDDINKAIDEVSQSLKDIVEYGVPRFSELSIAYSTDKYMIKGNVDYVFASDAGVNILDFKTGKEPLSMEDPKLIDYHNQINLYSYLFEQTKDEKVDSVSLYFTDQKNEKKLYKFERDIDKTQRIISRINEVIISIENEEFNFPKDYRSPNNLLRFFLDKYHSEITSNISN